MKRRRLAMMGSVAALLLVVAYAAQGASDVARVGNVGWWSKRPAAQPIPGPTSFEVASGPDGAESVAALRILIDGSVTKGTLILTEVANMGTAAISAPKIEVCITDTPWVLKTNPGPYTEAPTPACDKGRSPLVRDASGTWTADITSMLVGSRSEVSVMVVPAPDSTLPIPPTFIVDVATSRVETEGEPDVVPTTEPAVVAPPVNPSGPAQTPTRPSGPAVTTPAAVVTTPTTTAAPAAVVPKRLGGQRLASTSKPKHWARLIYLIPLSALLACGWVLGRKFAVERTQLASS